MLLQWNRVHNLTAWGEASDISAQLTAALSVYLPLLDGETTNPLALDLGTGGGIPGIPLALAAPECSFVLLDSRAKRIAFVRQAITELKLTNACAHLGRIEDYDESKHQFDFVLARAFGPIATIVGLTRNLLRPHGRWLLERGEIDNQESEWCNRHCNHVTCHPLPPPAKGRIIRLQQCS